MTSSFMFLSASHTNVQSVLSKNPFLTPLILVPKTDILSKSSD